MANVYGIARPANSDSPILSAPLALQRYRKFNVHHRRAFLFVGRGEGQGGVMIGQRYDIDGAAMVKHENGEWVRYDDFEAVMDVLVEMCRHACAWSCGRYGPMGSRTLHNALDVLVRADRLEWLDNESMGLHRRAKDKEAQG